MDAENTEPRRRARSSAGSAWSALLVTTVLLVVIAGVFILITWARYHTA